MRALLLSLLCAWGLSSAQIVISVDSMATRNKDKSLLGALAMTAVLPGSGHYYLGEKGRMRPYVWSDAAFWMVLAGSYFVGEQQLSTARDYAVRHAGATGVSRDPDLLSVIGDYRSRGGVQYQNSSPGNDEDYNQAMLRSGQAVDVVYPYAEGYIWDWGSSDDPATGEHIDEYKRLLRHYRLSRIAFQVSMGALALNRLVAMLDVLHVYRTTSATGLASSFDVLPLLSPGRQGAQVLLAF